MLARLAVIVKTRPNGMVRVRLIHDLRRSGANTLITRFFGMYRVKMHHLKSEMHFVIMGSVFFTDKDIQQIGAQPSSAWWGSRCLRVVLHPQAA